MAIAGYGVRTSIWLDYGDAAQDPKLLRNISAVVTAGAFLWTASDEGRTIECLEPAAKGFRLKRQIALAHVFPSLPGEESGDEADIESVDAFGGKLWICGSHCRVRRKPNAPGAIQADLRDRPSRRLLGCAAMKHKGAALAKPGKALPFEGHRSLREILRTNDYIAPFIDLPSKENGLDIEGLCISGKRLFLGLRGPLVDSIAIVAECRPEIEDGIKKSHLALHFLDLGGLGVRDLARFEEEIIIIAGPVSSAAGPFRLYRWRPKRTDKVQRPLGFREWPHDAEHPEGICRLDRDGKRGLLIVYDSPNEARIKGSRYRADWISSGR